MARRTTLKDVASSAGVSLATVSYVLNGKKQISEKTRQRVFKAIEELDYIPNLSARSLASNDSKLIGVVIPQTEPGSELMLENQFYSEILSSIEYNARICGYHIIVSATDINESYLTLAKKRNLDGIIVIGMYPDEFYKQMKKALIPIVLIDSYCQDHYYHSIRIDDAYGSYLATKYVLEKGHEKVAFFCSRLKENGVMQKRLLGYKQALEEKNIEFKKELVFEGNIDFDNGINLAKAFVKSKTDATAVVAAADILAIGAIKGFKQSGVKIPDDISIIGFDDLQIARYLPIGLTTIKQQISLKGEKAVELLIRSINEDDLSKQEVILPISLVERDSVKSLKSNI